MASSNHAEMTDVALIQNLAERLSQPFARAFATFLQETARCIGERHGPVAANDVDAALSRIPLDRTMFEAIAETILKTQQEQLLARTLQPSPLDELDGRRIVGRHLHAIANSKGMTQKQIAARLRVSPAVINRIFKHPERSKVQTLRRIADVLEVDVKELI